MSSRIADRLKAARRRQFVGRGEELELLQTTLAEPELPFILLYIFGPGGVGKTSLMGEFANIGNQLQFRTVNLDARVIEPTPSAFLATLSAALGVGGSGAGAAAVDIFAGITGRTLILIDTYETLAPLDGWLRDQFLPQMPEDVLVVLAGRNPLSVGWRSDPGWQSLMRVMPLRNLRPDESREFLAKRDIPPEHVDKVLDFTHGHPLALSLIADTFAQRGTFQLLQDDAVNIVAKLTEQFVQKVPSPAHRSALEACAMVRIMTEPLLQTMLRVEDAHDLFHWLRDLSFIESGQIGLFPHDLARDAITADVRWRNPEWFAELHKRARTYYSQRLTATKGIEQQRILLDYIYLHRDNPVVRPFFEWKLSGGLLTEQARESDIPALRSMVEKHEGSESAEFATFWLERQLGNTTLLRNSLGEPEGFVMMLSLDQATDDDIAHDPATAAVWNYLRTHATLRPGERATFFRYWMAGDTYQAISPIQSLIIVCVVLHYFTPSLAYSFFPCSEPDFWFPVFSYADLARIPEADFTVGGQKYGLYGHDWRTTPPLMWLSILAERELSVSPQPPAQTTQKSDTLVVLSRPDFEQAVKEALRNFTDLAELSESSLLKSRMVIERTGPEAMLQDRLSSLRALIGETVAGLESTPRGEKPYRALHRTFIKPAPTQERAAEMLDVPFSSYRRHLAAGIERVTQMLWLLELGR